MIQTWIKEYWEKNKKHFQTDCWKSNWLAGSFMTKSKAQIFPYITLDTEQKEHIWHFCK